MNLLAATLAQAPAGPTTQANPMALMLPLLLAMMVFMWLTARGQKKREKRERETMYASLAKNERVQTIGGIIGTIVSVKDDDVVVKVDESTNTKMTFVKTAIQRIVSDEPVASGSAR